MLNILRSDKISVNHGFTTRGGGVSTGAYASLNLRRDCGDDLTNVLENYNILARDAGFEVAQIAQTRQVHRDTVLRTVAPNTLFDDSRPECDALICDTPGIVLCCYAADCVPVLLFDPVRRTVAAVHCGWRGTALLIIESAVAEMTRRFGTNPADLTAAVGPGICEKCFEVDRDVADALRHTNPMLLGAVPLISKRGEKYHPNLQLLNVAQLMRAGVSRGNIDVLRHCSCCEPDLFWSHRRDGPERGVMAGFIVL